MLGLTETIMEWFGYDTIAYFNQGAIFNGLENLKYALDRRNDSGDTADFIRNAFRLEKSFGCGTWTGPDNDLLCVKRCRDRDEAELWLSPLAETPFGAAVAAASKSIRMGRLRRVTLGYVIRNGVRECGICGWKMGRGEMPEITDSHEEPGVLNIHCPACGHWLESIDGAEDPNP